MKKHPCFSKFSFNLYSRLHLPLVSSCNLSCIYCVRTVGYSNEYRPGISNHVINPIEAFDIVNQAIRKTPNLSTIGVSGPGEPLAEPETIIKTFELIRRRYPDINLCLSTNGLVLANWIDHLVKLRVKYFTITINAIDYEKAGLISKKVFFNNKYLTGVDAGKVLVNQQLKAVRILSEKDVFIKINIVLLPKINESEIDIIYKSLEKYKISLYNIIPVIVTPQTSNLLQTPSHDDINKARSVIPANKLMIHCNRCRADAFGVLAESR